MAKHRSGFIRWALMRRYEIEEIPRREAEGISKDRYVEIEQQRNRPISYLPEGLQQARGISSLRCFDNPYLLGCLHRAPRTALERARNASRFTL